MTDRAVPNKRKQLGEQSRAKILDAAERLLANRGYVGTTTTQLSKDSGLPVASIYWHFGSKSGVLAAVLERRANAVFQAIEDIGDHPADPFGALEQIVDRGLEAIRRSPDWFKLVAFLSMETHEDTESVAKALAAIHRHAVDIWCTSLTAVLTPRTKAQHERVMQLAELGRTMYLGGVVLYNTQGPEPLERAVQGYFALLCESLAEMSEVA